MPITLLHFGLLAPINKLTNYKVSNASFIFTTLFIDINSIIYYIFDIGSYDHAFTHTLLGVLITASLVCLFGFKNKKWALGAYTAAITHLILDGLVHGDMNPINGVSGNFIFLDAMEPVSLLLVPLLIWLNVQYVSGSQGLIEKLREDSGLSTH